MRRTLFALGSAIVLVAFASTGPLQHAGATPAGATVPSALEMADHFLTTGAGLDNEGSYALIDPIGPGGVKSLEAEDEVYASTLQGGIYHPWQPYRDPFAPQPAPPGPASPYKPGGSGNNQYKDGAR